MLRVMWQMALMAVVIWGLPTLAEAQLLVSNGTDIDMQGSVGSRIIFPDGSSMGSAATTVGPEGHGGTGTDTSGADAFVGGGTNNSATHKNAVVSGGASNLAGARYTTVGGGRKNIAEGNYATVSGGYDNVATGVGSTIAGGDENEATGDYAAVLGGWRNQAVGFGAMVGGGYSNYASGQYSIIPGGRDCRALGSHSFAAGRNAEADHNGSFVWADGDSDDFNSTAIDQFNARAHGGFRFATFEVLGGDFGVQVPSGGQAWESMSTKTLKENYTDIDTVEVLERLARIPIQRWNYVNMDASVQHIGPYAEDFYEAFQLNGEYNGAISTLDFDGVALASIQGLNKKLEAAVAEKDAALDALRTSQEAELSKKQGRIDALEARLSE